MSPNDTYVLKFVDGKFPIPKDKETAEKYEIMLREAWGLFIEKNNAYNSVFLEYGIAGIFVRIRDKLARLFSPDETVADESITENLLDIADYALMGAIISHPKLSKSSKCEHLFAIFEDETGIKVLRCIHCNTKPNI